MVLIALRRYLCTGSHVRVAARFRPHMVTSKPLAADDQLRLATRRSAHQPVGGNRVLEWFEMRTSDRSRRGSLWLNERPDEMRADLYWRETRLPANLAPDIPGMRNQLLSIDAVAGSHRRHDPKPIVPIAIVSDGICRATTSAAHIERSLLKIPLEL